MQLYCPATKCPELSEDDSLYGDFNMDEMDINIENYEELFGMALSHSEELFENGGFNSLFGTKDMSAGDSNCQDAVAAEVLKLLSFYVCDNLGFSITESPYAMFHILHTVMFLCIRLYAFVFSLIIWFL